MSDCHPVDPHPALGREDFHPRLIDVRSPPCRSWVNPASRRFIVLAAVLSLLCGAGGGALAYFALTRAFGG
jgi:hypothetical protein